jgi:hypothetical protein
VARGAHLVKGGLVVGVALVATAARHAIEVWLMHIGW